MKIDGPWAFKGVDGLETPVYIFEPGGERKDIGVARARIANPGGLQFEIELEEPYQNVSMASFEVPMRFTVHPHKPDDGTYNLIPKESHE